MRRWACALGLLACAACGDDGTSREVSNASAVIYPVPDWTSVDAAEMGFDTRKLETLASLAEADDSHCLVVTRKGRIVFERYFDGWSAANQQIVHSVTKSFTSTLVGIAQDRGLLSIEDKASRYIEEWAGTASDGVTVRDLLSNDSGRHWTFFEDYVSMIGLAPDKTTFALGLGQDHEPGTYWEYNNSAIQALDRVLKAASKQDVAAFAQANLFQPLGMTSAMDHDAAGNTLTFANATASCRDLARFGYLILRKGKWVDTQIVSEAWVDQATRPSQPLNAAYGLLWWLNDDGHHILPSAPDRREGVGKLIPGASTSTFYALGFGGQLVSIDPEHEIVMTRIGGPPTLLGAAAASGQGGDPVGVDVVAELAHALADAVRD